jgi:hypothetical protein
MRYCENIFFSKKVFYDEWDGRPTAISFNAKGIEATATLSKDIKIDLTAAVDSLKIELEVTKTYMERFHPEICRSLSKAQR